MCVCVCLYVCARVCLTVGAMHGWRSRGSVGRAGLDSLAQGRPDLVPTRAERVKRDDTGHLPVRRRGFGQTFQQRAQGTHRKLVAPPANARQALYVIRVLLLLRGRRTAGPGAFLVGDALLLV